MLDSSQAIWYKWKDAIVTFSSNEQFAWTITKINKNIITILPKQDDSTDINIWESVFNLNHLEITDIEIDDNTEDFQMKSRAILNNQKSSLESNSAAHYVESWDLSIETWLHTTGYLKA